MSDLAKPESLVTDSAEAARLDVDAAFAAIVGSTVEAVGTAPVEPSPSADERALGAQVVLSTPEARHNSVGELARVMEKLGSTVLDTRNNASGFGDDQLTLAA